MHFGSQTLGDVRADGIFRGRRLGRCFLGRRFKGETVEETFEGTFFSGGDDWGDVSGDGVFRGRRLGRRFGGRFLKGETLGETFFGTAF